MTKIRKSELIICPYCSREYLPAEIFIPNYIFGKPTDIVRDMDGQILEYSGTPGDLSECYTCDSCNNTFNVMMRMSFNTEVTKIGNIEEEYTCKLKKVDLFEI